VSRSTLFAPAWSEFVGVALFAAALIWLVSLASYEPSDAVWFFSTGSHAAPLNFAGRIRGISGRAVLFSSLATRRISSRPCSWSSAGITFWCRSVDAAGTKVIGAGLLFASSSALLSLVLSTLEVAGKSFRAGRLCRRVAGQGAVRISEPDRLAHCHRER